MPDLFYSTIMAIKSIQPKSGQQFTVKISAGLRVKRSNLKALQVCRELLGPS
jgi:hypothetical protein